MCQLLSSLYDPAMDAKAILKGELKRRGVTYGELARRLGTTEAYIKNKINRGGFSTNWFLKVLREIGAERIDIGD